MRQRIALATSLILALTITITGQPLNNVTANANANSKREELLEGTEAAKVIAHLGDLARPVLRERLKQMRQPGYQPTPLLVQKLVEAQKLTVANNKRVDQLKAALQPVLDYHGRSQMPIYVLLSDQPKAYLVECAVLFITTRMMLISTDEELRGIVAHELAHEYVWEERKQAKQLKDGQKMRECELFCDALAAFTLKEIGDDPASYGRILVRLTIIGINAGSAMKQESDTHPSLDARKKLNKFLCQRLD